MLIPKSRACDQLNSTKPLPAAWVAKNRATAAAVQEMIVRAQRATNTLAARSPWDYRSFGLNVMADVYRNNVQNGAPGYVPPGHVIGSSTPGAGLLAGTAGGVAPGSAINGNAGAGATPAGAVTGSRLGPTNKGWWAGWAPGAVPGGRGAGPGGLLSSTGLPPNPPIPGSWAGTRRAGGLFAGFQFPWSARGAAPGSGAPGGVVSAPSGSFGGGGGSSGGGGPRYQSGQNAGSGTLTGGSGYASTVFGGASGAAAGAVAAAGARVLGTSSIGPGGAPITANRHLGIPGYGPGGHGGGTQGANALRGATGASPVGLPKSQTGINANGFVGRGEFNCESAPAINYDVVPATPNPPAPPLTITPISPPPVLNKPCPQPTGNICADLRNGLVLASRVSPAVLAACSAKGYVGNCPTCADDGPMLTVPAAAVSSLPAVASGSLGPCATSGLGQAYPINCSQALLAADGGPAAAGISPWWWLLLAGVVVYAASDSGKTTTTKPRARRARA